MRFSAVDIFRGKTNETKNNSLLWPLFLAMFHFVEKQEDDVNDFSWEDVWVNFPTMAN